MRGIDPSNLNKVLSARQRTLNERQAILVI